MDDTVPDHFGRAKEMGSEEDGTLLLVEQLARRLGDAIAVSSNQVCYLSCFVVQHKWLDL